MKAADALLDQLEQPQELIPPPQNAQMSFYELIEAAEPPAEVVPRPRRPRRQAPPAPVSGRHQDVRLYLTVLLKTYVEMIDAGLVRDAPYRILAPDGSVLQPDIVFISHLNFDRVHETYMEGPPDIAVEVLTPESTATDRGEKFVAYETLGVRETWLIDPVREMVNFYHLTPQGLYSEFRPDMAGRMNSRVLRGFTLDVDRLWKRVLPTTVEIVAMATTMAGQR